MIRLWRRLNVQRRPVRWTIKSTIFGLVVFVVLFPDPRLVARHIRHWRDLDAMVRPDAPGLEDLQRELDAQWESAITPRDKLLAVQQFVERRIPYEWDWNTWWVVDYLPTVEEVLAKGKEDCDGRAILAASLLRGRGLDARLTGNTAHVWVQTNHGETMHPMRTKAFESTREGTRIQWKALVEFPAHFAYGASVFPLTRSLIILGAFWTLLLGTRVRWPVAAGGLTFMLATLWDWRLATTNPYDINLWQCWLGFVLAAVGISLTALSGIRMDGRNKELTSKSAAPGEPVSGL